MTATHLYMSTMPEALIASMLPAEEFGAYMAVGTQKRARGEACYFELKPGFDSAEFDLSSIPTRVVPHPDGQPKNSLYLAIYRVLERIPLKALGDLHLATRDGRVLTLKQSPMPERFTGSYHLYHQMCPVHPLIASVLNPAEFCAFITDPKTPVHVPRIFFAEYHLHGMADDPQNAEVTNPATAHIRDCLLGMTGPKKSKTVNRLQELGGWGAHIKDGFYVGDQTGVVFYRFPTHTELERDHHEWWRSASL